MKITKQLLVSVTLFFTLVSQAQIQFEEIVRSSFDGVSESSISYSDVDGDGDQDVLITGRNNSNQRIAKLYINDGNGNFTEDTSVPFDGVNFSSIAFSDVDGDGDEDVLITGLNSSIQPTTKLYMNDGNGNFTEDTSVTFEGVQEGSIAFSDIDGDGDQDVLITGRNNSNQRIAKLYINDGNGNFTEDTSVPFDGVRISSIAFSDVDGDGDQDVLITGQNIFNQGIAKLYINDGNGNFTEDTSVPFDGVSFSSIAFSDVDGDGVQDVLISGRNNSNQLITKLYINDGNGNFAEETSVSFTGVWLGSIAFSDIDGDGDDDLLITGINSSFQPTTKLYINDGSGNFTEKTSATIENIGDSSIAFLDVDGDDVKDVLVTGSNTSSQRISILYINDGNGNFAEDTSVPFEGLIFSSIAFSDVDGDGDKDVLISGFNNSNQRIAKLYINDGNGGFTEDTSVTFDGVQEGSITFSDVDGDGDKDVLITGINSSNDNIAKLYINDGNGGFTEDTSVSFMGVVLSSVAFSDIDGDGDEDVLITGRNNSNQRITKLYINDGNGNFTEDTSAPFEGVSLSSIAFSDVDGDGDKDVLITGVNSSNDNIAKLYINDGNGNFTEDTSVTFDGVKEGSIAFSDIDGDGDQDLLITGRNNFNQRIAKLYINDGNGNFTEDTSVPFDGVSFSYIAFSDVDGDGDQDVLITGINSSSQRIAKLYINDGNGNFAEETSIPFDGVEGGSIAFSDIDGDGDDDLLITGLNSSFLRITKLYINRTNNLDWLGTVNTQWSNASNWQPNQIPQSNNIVHITDVLNQPIIDVAETVEVVGLNLQGNTSLKVGGNLKVSNRINNNGQITFKSTEDKTAQFDTFTGTYAGSGTVEVERFIPEGRRAFRFVSPAVTTTSTIHENWQEDGASPSGFGTHITGDGGATNGFDETATNNPSLFMFDNLVENQAGGAAWSPVANTNVNTLDAGAPYRILVRGDRTIDLTTNTPTAIETVLRALGNLHLGDFSPVLSSFDANFNFVGNPYQATVNSKEVSYAGDINSNYIYAWDAQQGSNGSYVTIDMLDGSNTVSSNANQFIQPGQAFFIRNNLSVTTPPSMTFTEASKDVSQEQLSTFSVPNYAKVNLQLFTATSTEEQIVDAIGLRFSDDFTNEVNDADAGKMGNSGENLALVSSSQLLSIEQRKNPIMGEELQLFVNNYQTENYSLKLQLDNWTSEEEIFIKDNYLDTLTAISEEEEFHFSIDAGVAESTSPFRFSLVFGNQTMSNEAFDLTFLSLYPNPSTNVFFISGIDASAEVSVYDLLGRKVLNQHQVSNQQSIDISQLSKGVYMVQVQENGNEVVLKLVRE